jgi:serine protease inhibitor
MSVATDRHSGFAVDLLHASYPSTPGADAVVLSPWSVSSALAAVAPASPPRLRRRIEQAVGGPGGEGDPVAALAADAARVADATDADGEGLLAVANTLWVDDACTPVAEVVEGLGRWPGASLRGVPLRTDPHGARQTVNAAVAELTRDLVPELLPPGTITSDDRAVVVNALYLLAGWLEPFTASLTTDEPFRCPSGPRAVPTMRAVREVDYVDEAWQYLALPLDLGLTAEILVPPDDPLTAVDAAARVDTLDGALLRRCRQRASGHRVDLHLPRFRAETAVELTGSLHALGMGGLFESGALGLVVEERVHVSAAFHAAVLRVDERGIEGAAATALAMRAVAHRRLPEVEVRVDRPFAFLVTHRPTGAILFLAHVVEP